MPTYEYTCKSCGERTEAVQSFSDPSLTVCPNCGGVLRKVFGNIGIAFKGSGFYKNDSRSSSGAGKKTPASSDSSDGGSATNGASKSDSGSGSGEKSKSGDSSSSSSNGKTSSNTASGDSPKSPAKP